MKIFTLLVIISAAFTAHTCGNEYGHNLNGERIFTRYFYLSQYHRTFNKETIKAQLRRAKAKPDAQTNFKTQSNIALYHMKLGHVDSALNILEALNIKYPKEYIIIANLGTAYELDGQLKKALEFIKKGYEINPASHLGSEWIHIKILEAKIKEKQSPGWLRKHPIIEIDDLFKETAARPHIFRDNHLEFQIRTRVAFTPAPNKVMANLLETLAKYNEKHGSYENAIIAYIHVLEFTESNSKKRAISKDIIALNKKRLESGIRELPFVFKRLIESGKIDPAMMLYGIDEVAEHLQMTDDRLFRKSDSLRLQGLQIDSLSKITSPNTIKENKSDSDKLNYWAGIFGALGMVLGIAITTFTISKKNR